MRLRRSLRSSVAAEAAATAALLSSFALRTHAINLSPVASPNLDFSQLGRVALAGDFDSIATYSFQGQTDVPFTANGSQGLFIQAGDGVYAPLAATDASIVTMCPFVRKGGDFAGIVVGGNFTMLQGIPAQGVALWDPASNDVTPLPGLNGSVNAVYCDEDMDSVYVGGMFHGGNSTNAIVWVGMSGWSNMPFAGFNGPVNTINMQPNGNILFGGSFTSLGNTTTPSEEDQQIVNLGSANITAGPPATDSAFNDPKSIICQQSDTDGPGTTWLTADNGGGFYNANFDFGFIPSKLRLYNTHYEGRGTKTFHFTAFPINGILNLTYFNPDTQTNESCTNECPLSQNSSVKYQDFNFVNPVGLNGFQIDITDFYGDSAGLDGIELFSNDIYTYADNSINEPACGGVSFPAKATTVGPWQVEPSGMSGSPYLQAVLKGPGVNSQSAQVVYEPDIRQSGTYMVSIYTPGCTQDNSCSQRGISNVTGIFSSGGQPVTKQIYQTNEFDKYDQIFSGPVDASSSSFRPSITVSPLDTQNSSINLVALRVRFELMPGTATSSGSSGGGGSSSSGTSELNGLFDYNPAEAFSTNFASDKIDAFGAGLNPGAAVNNIAILGDSLFIGGNFTTSHYSNIFQVNNGNAVSLPSGGLNGAVTSMYVSGSLLFVAGNFTNTAQPSVSGLSGVAVYDTTTQKWGALGSGVNGQVNYLVPLQLNITADQPETCITVNGQFTSVLASGSFSEFPVTDGLAVFVPSQGNWLQNLNLQLPSIQGSLTAATNISGQSPLLAGSVSAQGWALSDSVSLSTNNGYLDIAPIGLTFEDSSSNGGSGSQQKRDLSISNNFSGAVTGLFEGTNGQNLTILAGHFATTASDNTPITNLAILNATSNGEQGVSGLAAGVDRNSTFRAVAINGTLLYAGGQVTGNISNNPVGGLVVWDLSADNYPIQPPALSGDDAAVYSIAMRPDSADLYVAGNFEQAGALPCPSLCYYSDHQWQAPASGLSGTVSNLLWQSDSMLLLAGNMSVEGNATYLATYDADQQSTQWTIPPGADEVPGPVVALVQASSDGSEYWIAGTGTNGSSYLIQYDGSKFNSVPDVFGSGSDVRGLSVVSLSQDHDGNNLLAGSLGLLITGNINIPSFGNASAVLFNGTSLTPLLLTQSGDQAGTLSQMIVQNSQNFGSVASGLPLGDIVAIALAIALGVMFLLIALGLLIERRRRQAEGYRPAPQNYFEKTANMGRIPPERLFSSLHTTPSPPRTSPPRV